MARIPWLILPTYDEAENIEAIVGAARKVLEDASPEGFKILVVDDDSPDGTGRIADRLAAEHEEVEVLHRTQREGLGPAYIAGFRYALDRDAGFVFEMDADFSHDPSDLPRLVAAIEDGADLAIGSRYVPGGSTPDWPWHRKFLSRGGNLYARIMLGHGVKDSTAGYRAFRAGALSRLPYREARASGYGFQVEMAWKAAIAGMRIVEIPVVFRDRTRGTSKMGGSIVAEAMWLVTVWGIRNIPARLRRVGR